ncbi:TetR/AcrR family transcriptional regulator [Deinococcus multiflagellatus]|uniref:TetR/AcrR family transcriptional regulator n=1 Tax=Deinococcus multiflagellatus TaxID=1656887 RepID=A0ABW1ZF97_9DEIO
MPYPAKLTPEAIQAAAWALLEQGGPAALGMRPLAEALGVRPSSLYRHVGSREALLTTLAEQAASALRTELTAAAGLPPARRWRPWRRPTGTLPARGPTPTTCC